MTKGDFDNFAAYLVETAGRYNKTLSAADINTYFDNFTEHTLTAVKNAVAMHAKDVQNGRFFPRIIDLQQQLTISRSGVSSDHREPPRCDYLAGRQQCRYPVFNVGAVTSMDDDQRFFCRFHRNCVDPRVGAEIVQQSETVPYQQALEQFEARAGAKRARDLLTARGWVGDCRPEQEKLLAYVRKYVGSDRRRKWMIDVVTDFFAGKVSTRAPLEICEEGLGFKLKPDTLQHLRQREEAARLAEEAARQAAQDRLAGGDMQGA